MSCLVRTEPTTTVLANRHPAGYTVSRYVEFPDGEELGIMEVLDVVRVVDRRHRGDHVVLPRHVQDVAPEALVETIGNGDLGPRALRSEEARDAPRQRLEHVVRDRRWALRASRPGQVLLVHGTGGELLVGREEGAPEERFLLGGLHDEAILLWAVRQPAKCADEGNERMGNATVAPGEHLRIDRDAERALRRHGGRHEIPARAGCAAPVVSRHAFSQTARMEAMLVMVSATRRASGSSRVA